METIFNWLKCSIKGAIALSLLTAATAASSKEVDYRDLVPLFHEMEVDPGSTLESMADAAQIHFSRDRGIERWEVIDQTGRRKADRIRAHLKAIGFFDKVMPVKHKKHDVMVILGAAAPAVDRRFALAKELFDQGDVPHMIVYAGSQRPLAAAIEPEDIFDRSKYRVEGDLVDYFIPKYFDGVNFDQLGVEVVKIAASETKSTRYTPPFKSSNKRPSRYDTLNNLYEKIGQKENGKLLLISNQPYVMYDRAVAETVFKGWDVEVVGQSANCGKISPVNLLDAVAKWLLAEKNKNLLDK